MRCSWQAPAGPLVTVSLKPRATQMLMQLLFTVLLCLLHSPLDLPPVSCYAFLSALVCDGYGSGGGGGGGERAGEEPMQPICTQPFGDGVPSQAPSRRQARACLQWSLGSGGAEQKHQLSGRICLAHPPKYVEGGVGGGRGKGTERGAHGASLLFSSRCHNCFRLAVSPFSLLMRH
jgi:hypothetical protein